MFRNFLHTALRSLWCKKIYSFISIASMTLGLTVFAFSFLYVKKEFTYDRSWPGAEHIYRLTVEQRGLPGSADGSFSSVSGKIWPQITEYFSGEIEMATRISLQGVKPEDAVVPNYQNLVFADPGFTGIFRLEVLQGNLERVFEAPGYVALEESYAASLGVKSEVGETLKLEAPGRGKISYQVAAIYRLPENISTFLNFRMLTLAHDYSLPLLVSSENPEMLVGWQNSSQIWVRLKEGINIDAFNAMQPDFIDRELTAYNKTLEPDDKISAHLFYVWQKITDIHFNPLSLENFSKANSVSRSRVLTFSAVGILVLLVGCSNSVSLSLAAALERRHEIGVRKAVGAQQRDILLQYLGEAILFALLALVPALLIFGLLQPAFVSMLPFTMLALKAGFADYFMMFAVAVFAGIISGTYPALLLSSFKPEAALKPGSGTGIRSGQKLRTFLVALQFGLASMLLIGTAALYVQLDITRSQTLGFSAENTGAIFLASEQIGSGAALAEEFRKIPGVVTIAPGFSTPNQNLPLGVNSVTLVRKNGYFDEVRLEAIPASPGMFKIYEIPVVAGRIYDNEEGVPDRDFITNQSRSAAPGRPFVLNRSGVNALGFDSPEAAIDQIVYWKVATGPGELREIPYRVIAVVEDNMFASLHRRPVPEMYMLDSSPTVFSLLFEYEDAVEASLLKNLNEVSRQVTGFFPSEIEFSETIMDRAFRQAQNETSLLLISGGLTLVLASIGLFGLASFVMERNVKEVGVRKVLGSTVSSIMLLFVWRFSRPVLLANLLSWPVAAYFVLEWIKQFPYQLEKIWLLPLCMAAAVLVLLIAILTVSVITARAAAAKPVQSLRYE